jgi:energy-coupling factor transport system permease protein
VAGLGLAVGARGGGRSTYRPEPWRAPEWLTVACAAASVGLFVASPGALTTGVTPPALPALSPAIVVAVALVVLPAWLSPPLPRGRRTGARMSSGRPAAEVPA